MTWGEAVELIDVVNERERRKNKLFSVIGFETAIAINQMLVGDGKRLKIEELYPFWTEEECTEIRIERLKNALR